MVRSVHRKISERFILGLEIINRLATASGFGLLRLAGGRASTVRYSGPIADVQNEWAPLVKDNSSSSPALLALLMEAVRGASARGDLSSMDARLSRGEVNRWPGEHYRLLPALMDSWRARHVVEIGTFEGVSALSLLCSSTVESVVTFDLVAWHEFPSTLFDASDFDCRLRQEIGDLSDPAIFAEHTALLSRADAIFLDGPKDFGFEHKFLSLLLDLPVEKPQLLVFDDIRVSTMAKFWHELPLEKFDATSLGHWSGTGLAIHDPNDLLTQCRLHGQVDDE